VTAALAKALVGLVDEVRISIDGMQERNDRLRGKGNFAAAVNGLGTYYDAGFEPKALITVASVSMCDLYASDEHQGRWPSERWR
jgi:MoaA/NifB/PqqE/SkfB family radical SAM enzyme